MSLNDKNDLVSLFNDRFDKFKCGLIKVDGNWVLDWQDEQPKPSDEEIKNLVNGDVKSIIDD